MERLRSLAPIVIAAVVILVAVDQLPSLDGFWRQRADAHPCQSLYDPPGLATGTPVPEDDTQYATITTILAVEAPNGHNPELHSIIKAQTSPNSASSQTEILNLLHTYLDKGTTAGAPRWDLLDSVLEFTPGNAADIGILQKSEIPALGDYKEQKDRPHLGDIEKGVPDNFWQQLSGPPMIYGSDDQLQIVIPIEGRSLVKTSDSIGGWEISTQGPTLKFTFPGSPSNATWRAKFCVDGLQILSVDPTPIFLDNNRAEWVMSSGDAQSALPATGITVTTTAPRDAWFRQLLSGESVPTPACGAPTTVPVSAGSDATPVPGGPTAEPSCGMATTVAGGEEMDPARLAGESIVSSIEAKISRILERLTIRTTLAQVLSILVSAWALLAPAALLAVGVWRSNPNSRDQTPLGSEVVEAWKRLRSVTVAVAVLSISGVLALVIRNNNVFSPLFAPADAGGSQDWSAALRPGLLPLLVLLIIGAAFFTVTLYGREHNWWGLEHVWPGLAFLTANTCLVLLIGVGWGWKSIQRPLGSSLLVAGYLTFFLTGIALWKQLRVDPGARMNRSLLFAGIMGLPPCIFSLATTQFHPDDKAPLVSALESPMFSADTNVKALEWLSVLDAAAHRPLVVIGLAVMTAIWVTGTVVVGFWLQIVALLPRQTMQTRPDSTQQATRLSACPGKKGHCFLAGTIIVLVVVIQWLLAAYNQLPFSDRAIVEADFSALPGKLSAGLQKDALDYLTVFLQPSLVLLPLLGLAGLLAALNAASRDRQSLSWGRDEWWVRRILGFLFAAYVVGYGGQVLGVQAPLAFVIGLFLFELMTSDFVQRLVSDWFPHAATTVTSERETSGVSREAPEDDSSLPHGLPLTPSLHSTVATGATTSIILAIPRHRARAVPSNGSKTVATPVPNGANGAKRAANQAIGDDAVQRTEPGWWEHGFLALRLGGILAILPIAYFLHVLTNPRAGLAASQLVPAAFFTPIATEIAFWLTAAFVFGCAYHYLLGENGLQKGIALTAVYAVANLGAAVIGVTGDPLWMVRTFQLWLFLMVLGLWLEHEAHPRSLKRLFADFDNDKTRNIAKHILPVATALGVVISQLVQNIAFNTITTLISGSDSVLCLAKLVAAAGQC